MHGYAESARSSSPWAAGARAGRAEAALYQGDARGAAAHAEAAAREATAAGYVGVELAALPRWAEALRILGRAREAQPRLEESIRRAAAVPQPLDRLRMQATLASISLGRGHLARAGTIARGALAEARALPGTAARLSAAAALAAATSGDLDAARQLVRRRGRARVAGYDDVEQRLAQVAVLLWDGRVEEAAEQALQLRERAAARGWRWLGCRAALLEAEGRYRLGAFDAAARIVAAAGAVAAGSGYAAEELQRGLLAGALARCRGDAPRAAAAWRQVASRAQRWDMPVEAEAAGVALRVLAGQRSASGSPGAAVARRLFLTEPVTCRLRTRDGEVGLSARHAASLDDAGFGLYVDLVTGRVKDGARRIDLAHHQVLAAVLAALLDQPGEGVDQEGVTRRVWHTEFHPVRHRGRVSVTMGRLRRLLGGRLIATTAGCYRVNLPDAWAILEPLPAAAAAQYRR